MEIFEVTVTVYPYQPASIMWLVANVGVKIGERCVAELDATIMEVLRHPAIRVKAETPLSLIGVVGSGLELDSALPVLDGRGEPREAFTASMMMAASPADCTLKTTTRSGAAIGAQCVATNFLNDTTGASAAPVPLVADESAPTKHG
jgi:hypothetical protein